MRSPLLVLGLCLLAATAVAGSKSERKRELDVLRKELRFVDLRARQDLRAAGPEPGGGAVIELEDGSVYFQEDPGLVFEKLSPIRVEKLTLRGGNRLLVRLQPPSNLRPRLVRSMGEGSLTRPDWNRMVETGPLKGRRLVTSVDLDEYGSAREALSELIYFPGESASAEELEACFARYPDHEEAVSLMRCGGGE
jgi:hypothetical protein